MKLTVCENTAAAAKLVAESDRRDIAALSSRSCAELYDLSCLADSVQDKGNNYTRFICICKELEILPGADRTSLMVTLPHETGSLYKLLSRFFALEINLLKLESRPIRNGSFDVMFYLDFSGNIHDTAVCALLSELSENLEYFKFLGNFSEI